MGVDGLARIGSKSSILKLSENQTLLLMEFVLHGLAEFSQVEQKLPAWWLSVLPICSKALFNTDLADEDEDDLR
jgi:magnesium chelatase subunit I